MSFYLLHGLSNVRIGQGLSPTGKGDCLDPHHAHIGDDLLELIPRYHIAMLDTVAVLRLLIGISGSIGTVCTMVIAEIRRF